MQRDPIKAPPGRRYFVPTDSDEPRNDITGQPLTVQEQFNQESG